MFGVLQGEKWERLAPQWGRKGEWTILTNEEYVVPPYEYRIWVGGGAHCREDEWSLCVVCYLSCSEGVSCRTSSHRWSRLYLPRFLLSEGSFTWMHMVSLIVLVAPLLPCQLWWSIPDPPNVPWSDCVDIWVMMSWGVPWICH